MGDTVFTPNPSVGDSKLNPQLGQAVNKKVIDAKLEEARIKEQGKKEERGFLGRVWGSIEHSSNNIAGLFIILLLIIGAAYTCCMFHDNPENHSKILEFWGMLSPMLTLALGYLFGRGQSGQT